MDAGSDSPKLLKLLELIEEHPVAVARDFRERFGLSYLDIGSGITYLEAWQLVESLLQDTTSWVFTVVAGWKFPVSREWMLAADHYDLLHAANSKRRPKPYPRPWPETKNKIGGKKTVKRSITDVLAILRPGHKAE